MSRRFTLPAVTLIVLTGLPALADHYTPMSNDQNLAMAVNEMLGTYGGVCQTYGNAFACGKVNEIQQTVNYMTGADQACQQGDQNGCQAYLQAYQWMDTEYGAFLQIAGAPQIPQDGGGGSTFDGGGGFTPTPLLPGESYPGEFASDERQRRIIEGIRQ